MSAVLSPPTPAGERTSRPPGWDALLLALLVFALLQITGLAEQAALPNRVQDVLRHPILGNLLPPAGMAASLHSAGRASCSAQSSSRQCCCRR